MMASKPHLFSTLLSSINVLSHKKCAATLTLFLLDRNLLSLNVSDQMSHSCEQMWDYNIWYQTRIIIYQVITSFLSFLEINIGQLNWIQCVRDFLWNWKPTCFLRYFTKFYVLHSRHVRFVNWLRNSRFLDFWFVLFSYWFRYTYLWELMPTRAYSRIRPPFPPHGEPPSRDSAHL